MSPDSQRNPANLIAQYEDEMGEIVEIHGLRGGYAVFVGDRMVQERLGGREFACYMAHVLQGVSYRLSKAIKSAATDSDGKG